MRIIFSGGGSGGHVFPAIAIADTVKKINPDVDILFVGASGKIEIEKVPKAGYPIKALWISGFQRKWSLKNILFPIKLLFSLLKAFGIVWKFKPDVVVGVGGYASGPTLQVSSILGIPTLIQEQNSFPGITNRLLAKRVDRICVAYDHMERFFPQENIVKTGNPVRSVLINSRIDSGAARMEFGFAKEKKTILLFGGSLGASTLNRAMGDSAEMINSNPDIQWIWQAGKLYYEQYRDSATAQLDNVEIRPFLEKMENAYAAADLVIARAGALTISELEILGKAAILVPSPNVAEDHQTKNAQALVQDDAAEMVKDIDAKNDLIREGIRVVQDEKLLSQLSQKIKNRSINDASVKIANEVLNLKKK